VEKRKNKKRGRKEMSQGIQKRKMKEKYRKKRRDETARVRK
jgi:hypothetical protein